MNNDLYADETPIEAVRRERLELERRQRDLIFAASFKLTPWFENGEKPAHKGIYLAKNTCTQQIGFRYFNGRRWKPWAPNIQWAFNLRDSYIDAHQLDAWKGIAK